MNIPIMLWPSIFHGSSPKRDPDAVARTSGMHKRQPGGSKRRVKLPPVNGLKRRKTDAAKVFARVYKLLEEYGPRWYSLELRRELQAALKSFHL
jgi:hypothetical protein